MCLYVVLFCLASSDVTDPEKPVVLGFLPTTTVPSSWRDMKVYKNYVYIGAEAPDHGIECHYYYILTIQLSMSLLSQECSALTLLS